MHSKQQQGESPSGHTEGRGPGLQGTDTPPQTPPLPPAPPLAPIPVPSPGRSTQLKGTHSLAGREP